MEDYLSRFSTLIFGSVAGFLSANTGVSYELIIIVQWLFVADVFIGMIEAYFRNFLNWHRVYSLVVRVVSLYTLLWIIGIGVYSYNYVGDYLLAINSSVLFNIVIFTLIIYELQRINKYFANLNFKLNQRIDFYFTLITKKLLSKIAKEVGKIDEIDSNKHRKNRYDKRRIDE